VTEINVTSPTGLRELESQFSIDIGALFIDAVAQQLQRRAARDTPVSS
jgi:glutathione synthase/RimK-type ligase-like ATP-grasp enzyme